MSRPFHLAQANIARMRAPLDSPIMETFRSQLAHINAVAEASPGFVWRFQADEGDATAARVFDDDALLFNMSVWETREALFEYVYRSAHSGPLRNRGEWFAPLGRSGSVMWWIPAGQIPSVEDAKAKLELLDAKGPTAEAFTFKQPFPPPSTSPSAPSSSASA